jgi:predicted RNA-binding Zn-ribbon protein involved in translation (DUF1610 family)
LGYKKVCFSCRKAFNVDQLNAEKTNLNCPECGNKTILFDHKFRPPKQSDVNQWMIVEFLKDNGFVYQHVYVEQEPGLHLQIKYPKTMEEAREFVARYKDQGDHNL